MHTYSGILKFTHKEESAMRTVLHHAKIDLKDGGNGTYAKSTSLDNEPDLKEMAKAKNGIEIIEWILNTYAQN